MGIYLGQLPPAELARLKAELAETLITNFCYPRFFDYRTESLRMRPVDRAKRQEVWLYLSSVDFTTWGRVDLMSPDFQRQIERLFIQFVQRNRSFFGEQGRRRMSDIRMLIGSSATSVVQGLRNHITGQRPVGVPAFGSPRSVVSWSTIATKGQPDLPWERIASATMLLQQQLQEARGEVRPTGNDGRAANVDVRATSNGARRPTRPPESPAPSLAAATMNRSTSQVNGRTPISPTPPPDTKVTTSPLNPAPMRVAAPATQVAQAPVTPVVPATPARKSTPLPPLEQPAVSRKSTDSLHPGEQQTAPSAPVRPAAQTLAPEAVVPPVVNAAPATPVAQAITTSTPTSVRSLSSMAATAPATVRDNPLMRVGEDDIAIFEQLRHQLIMWLRIEAIRAGLEIDRQTPPQLLELLQRQEHMDETRLQVVSTLLNLSNQVIANGQVSVLDYKQALMFHLMHTRR